MTCMKEITAISRGGPHTAVTLLLNAVGLPVQFFKVDVEVRSIANLKPTRVDFEAEYDGPKFPLLAAAVAALLKPRTNGSKARATTELEFLAKYQAVASTAVQWGSLDRPRCWLAVLLRLKGTTGPWSSLNMTEDKYFAYRQAVLEHGVLEDRFAEYG